MSTLPRNLDHAIDECVRLGEWWHHEVRPGMLKHGLDTLGWHPSCLRCGDPACCEQVILVQLMDALPVARALHRTERDTPKLRSTLAIRAAEQGATPIVEWRNRKIPCDLLEDGRCAVYGARPFTCREHHVWSPAEWCRMRAGLPAVEADEKYPIRKFGSTFTPKDFEIGLERGLHLRRTTLYQNTLPRAILTGLEALDLAAARRRDEFRAYLSEAPSITKDEMDALFGSGWEERFREVDRKRREAASLHALKGGRSPSAPTDGPSGRPDPDDGRGPPSGT